MASIETRKNPRTGAVMSYRVSWRQDGRKQLETLGTEPAAMRFQADVEQAGNRWPVGWVKGAGYPEMMKPEAELLTAETGRVVPSVGAAAEDYWNSERHDMQAHAVGRVRSVVTRHGKELWDTPIESVSRRDAQRVVDAMRTAGLAFNTIDQFILQFGTVFGDYAQHNEVAMPNPVKGMLNPDPVASGKKEARAVFMTRAEYNRARARISDPVIALLVDILADTGLRVGEARALRPRDLELTGPLPGIAVSRTIKSDVHGRTSFGAPKTTKSRRFVSIDPELVEKLTDVTAGLADDDLLFPTLETNAGYIRALRIWNVAAADAGIAGKPRFHDLRHSHASWLLGAGITLFVVSRRLGHATIAMTANVYGHLERSADAGAASAMATIKSARPALRVVS